MTIPITLRSGYGLSPINIPIEPKLIQYIFPLNRSETIWKLAQNSYETGMNQLKHGYQQSILLLIQFIF